MTDRKVGRQPSCKTTLCCWFLFAFTFAVVGVSHADQNHSKLGTLFEQLKQAQSNSAAQVIEAQIWEAWLEAPDDNANALMSQLTYAMSVGELQIALRLSNQLVDSNPSFAEGWNKRATIQYLLGNHGQSVADIKETLLLEPRHFGALSGLGLIFMASENYAAALDAFNAVLALSPSSDNARGSVATVESMVGEDI